MKSVPAISVVMSVYNGGDFLQSAVDSILAQTFTDFEFIIIDDGSTDDTWQSLSSAAAADERIVLLQNKPRLGLTRSLNLGFKHARSPLIARQDADDISLPQRFEKQIDFLLKNPEIGVLGVRPIFVNEDLSFRRFADFPTEPENIRTTLFSRNVICHGSVIIRRACIESVGLYREFFHTSQDRDYWLRISEQYPIANLEENLYYSRVHEASVSHVKKTNYKRIIVDFAEKRARKEEDDLGLGYGRLWLESQSGLAKIKYQTAVKSYNLYFSAQRQLKKKQYFFGALIYVIAFLLNRRNNLIKRPIIKRLRKLFPFIYRPKPHLSSNI